MGNRYGLIIIGLIVALLMGGALYWAARSRAVTPAPATPANPTAAPTAKPDAGTGVKIEGARLEQKGPDGQVRWRVTADAQLAYNKDNSVVTGKQVKFVVLQKAQTPVSVTAASFTADYPKRRLVFEQGVKGQLLPGGASFVVNRLEYQFANQKLVGTGGAKFVKGGYRVTADSLVVDTARHKVRLSGQLRFARSE